MQIMQEHTIQHQVMSKAMKFAAVHWQYTIDDAKVYGPVCSGVEFQNGHW